MWTHSGSVCMVSSSVEVEAWTPEPGPAPRLPFPSFSSFAKGVVGAPETVSGPAQPLLLLFGPLKPCTEVAHRLHPRLRGTGRRLRKAEWIVPGPSWGPPVTSAEPEACCEWSSLGLGPPRVRLQLLCLAGNSPTTRDRGVVTPSVADHLAKTRPHWVRQSTLLVARGLGVGVLRGPQLPGAPSRRPLALSPQEHLLRPAPGRLLSPRRIPPRRTPVDSLPASLPCGAFREPGPRPGRRTETLKHRTPRPVVLHPPGSPAESTPWAPNQGTARLGRR